MLKFRRLSADGLTFYWITYPEQAELIARQAAFYPGMQSAAQEPAPTHTLVPEEWLSQAVSRWVKVDQGLDLDSGAIAAGWNGADDLVVTAGEVNEVGRLLNLQLQPAGLAAVQGGPGFDQAPTAADCRQTVDYTNRPLIITDLYRFRCFQTSEGRLGYLYVHESNPGVGVRLDWVTWPAVQEQTVQPEPSPTAIESGAAVKVMAPPQATGVNTYRPGSQITFTWQITNTGRVTWNTRYALVLARGSALGGPEKKLIPYPITNGMTVRLALSLTVPAEPGAYLAEYWLVDDTGRRFGIGGNGSRPLQLIINSGEPGFTLAEGQGARLAPGECFDLDTGYPSIDDPACDFSVSASADPAMAQIYSSQTGFDFITP
ncbi:MAG: NBR1-Ig-like domain-containing protein, partial [Anaerolineaceae bacterium]